MSPPISLTPSLHLALFTPFIINLYKLFQLSPYATNITPLGSGHYFNSPLMWAFESCKIFPISHPLDHDGHETSDGLEDSKKQDHGQEPPRSAVYWIGSSRSTWPWMVANEWRRLLKKQFNSKCPSGFSPVSPIALDWMEWLESSGCSEWMPCPMSMTIQSVSEFPFPFSPSWLTLGRTTQKSAIWKKREPPI